MNSIIHGIVAAVTFITGAAQASTVVLPLGTGTANSNASFLGSPFNELNGTTRIQQLFSGTDFASVSGPTGIAGIAFRPSTTGPGFTFSSVEVELATVSESSLSPVFATNVSAPNESVVFDGSLMLPSVTTTPTPGSEGQFEVTIPFTTVFSYNPAAGNLLVDILVNSTTTGTYHISAETTSTGTLVFSQGASGVSAASGTVQDFLAVTQLTTIPEPATISLLGNGILALLVLWIRGLYPWRR